MGNVSILLNGKVYRFVCGDGEEARIAALGDHLRAKLAALGHDLGRPGDDRLLVMAALMIADELFETRGEIDNLTAPAAQSRPRKPNAA